LDPEIAKRLSLEVPQSTFVENNFHVPLPVMPPSSNNNDLSGTVKDVTEGPWRGSLFHQMELACYSDQPFHIDEAIRIAGNKSRSESKRGVKFSSSRALTVKVIDTTKVR
jgi:hypothetical protein